MLCSNCVRKVRQKNMGNCKKCGAPTASSSFNHCGRCARVNNQCALCQGPLSGSQPNKTGTQIIIDPT